MARPPKDNNATHQVCFRCTAGEHAELKRLAAVAGVSMSALLLDGALGEERLAKRALVLRPNGTWGCRACRWGCVLGDIEPAADVFQVHDCADHPVENLPEAESGE